MDRIKSFFKSNINFDNHNKLAAFLLTSVGYAIVHCNRKTLSTVKHDILKIWTVQNDTASFSIYPEELWQNNVFKTKEDAANFLGVLDFLFLFSYAGGMYISGYLIDRSNPAIVFSCALIIDSIINILFGVVTERFHLYNRAYYGVIWFINGLCQSTCWPAAIGIMGAWFKGKQGLAFGIWSAVTQSGNILADLLCGFIVEHGYDMTFLVNSNIMLGFGLICLVALTSCPEKIDPNLHDTDENNTSKDGIVPLRKKTLSYWQILRIPGVVLYALSFACIKLVNYAIFFWLPLYLSKSLHWPTSLSSKVTASCDFGSIFGAIFAGYLADLRLCCFSKHCVNYVLIILSIPVVLAYRFTPSDPIALNSFALFVMGFVLEGPYVITCAVFSADLNRKPEYKGTRLVSTVSGLINGTGSFCAALGQIFIPRLGNAYGWFSIFYFFMTLMVVCLIIITPVFVRDVRSRKNDQKPKPNEHA